MRMLLTSIMMVLLALTPIEENRIEFDNEVNNGYKTYVVIADEDTINYNIKIVLGELEKEEIAYSIVYTPANPKNSEEHYELGMRFKDAKFNLLGGEDDYGSRIAYSFMPQNGILLLEVKTRDEVTKTYELKTYNKKTYDEEFGTTVTAGLNKGLTPTKFTREKHLGTMFILSIVFSSIILIAVIVILILSLTKKGLFNKQKLEEEVKDDFNYQSFVDSVQQMNQMNNQNEFNNPNNPIEVEATEVVEEKEEPVKEVYTKVRDYDIEEEQDVSKLLRDKGFNTDYKNMSEDDKNKIMLELMKMKNFKEISETDYKNEVIKLWM